MKILDKFKNMNKITLFIIFGVFVFIILLLLVKASSPCSETFEADDEVKDGPFTGWKIMPKPKQIDEEREDFGWYSSQNEGFEEGPGYKSEWEELETKEGFDEATYDARIERQQEQREQGDWGQYDLEDEKYYPEEHEAEIDNIERALWFEEEEGREGFGSLDEDYYELFGAGEEYYPEHTYVKGEEYEEDDEDSNMAGLLTRDKLASEYFRGNEKGIVVPSEINMDTTSYDEMDTPDDKVVEEFQEGDRYVTCLLRSDCRDNIACQKCCALSSGTACRCVGDTCQAV